MTTIGFIRHGITEWNVLGKAQGISDIPLNNTGKEQALALGNRLQNKDRWDFLISSDLSRAYETAKIISDLLHLPVHLDKRIREIHCGKIEGTTEEERINTWGENWRELDLGMEKYEEVAKRGIEFLEYMTAKHKDKKVLIVSHGALIGLTLQHLLPEKFPTTYIDNASFTILEKTNNRWKCPLYNCTAHFLKTGV
ncbi:histidine phosphatase family protein [Bacillus sp. FJAT-49732]|uniref:Histidine phosphatase family protein n=1 Tax=Lederbergia citrisecunda TaxID=2833583 RepID=A0A942TQC2_9BACI|nr:histidine phosphatase family protein [Lederbergia citrisecunda]